MKEIIFDGLLFAACFLLVKMAAHAIGSWMKNGKFGKGEKQK